jgi:glycosyltransferase involved in cell wall biosynthesis
MALAEALASGLPVVSTTGGAIPHTVPAGAGLLVEPGDHLALAHALGELLSSSAGAERRAELATAARRYGRTLPTWDQATRAFGEAVLELTPDE